MKRRHIYAAGLMICALWMCFALAGCRSPAQQRPNAEQAQQSPRLTEIAAVSHDGEAVELTVPDAVSRIDADLFRQVDAPEKVTHIALGGNVETVSPTAFDRFPALRDVTIPEENPFFRAFTDESWDNAYLCGIDRPLIFCFPGSGAPIHLSGDADAPYFYGTGVDVDFVCGGAVFTIRAEKDGDGAVRWYCSSMRHGEDLLMFPQDEAFQGGNYVVDILRTSSDDIVFQRKSGVDADAYILTASGDHANSYSWHVRDGALSFHLGDGGELRYEKVGYAYSDFEQYAVRPAGVDGSAIYSEEGVAAVVDGALVLTADKTCTVSDYWNRRNAGR